MEGGGRDECERGGGMGVRGVEEWVEGGVRVG